MSSDWHVDFWGCTQAMPQCLCACLCPGLAVPLIQASSRNKLQPGTGVFTCCISFWCCCIGQAINRGKVREYYGIDGGFCKDCLVYFCCCYICASVQEFNEVNFNMNAGNNK